VQVQIDRAADDLASGASKLTGHQLMELAQATRRSMGHGLAAYLGLGHPSAAIRAASDAVQHAGREPLLRSKGTALSEAVLTAAIAASSLTGRDTAGVRAAWDEYKAAVESGDKRRRKRAFQASRKVFRRGFGPLNKKWFIASTGAHWALVAIVSWDLALGGTYTPEQREELTRPWVSVAPLPPVTD
jgi:hypothetical protein